MFTKQEQIKINKTIKEIKKGKIYGKPLSYSFFREIKIGGKRIYFLIYNEIKVVLFVAVSTKKAQKITIKQIKKQLPSLKRSVFDKLRKCYDISSVVPVFSKN